MIKIKVNIKEVQHRILDYLVFKTDNEHPLFICIPETPTTVRVHYYPKGDELGSSWDREEVYNKIYVKKEWKYQKHADHDKDKDKN